MTAPVVIHVPTTGAAVTSYVYRRRAEDGVGYVARALGELLYGHLTRDGRVPPSGLDWLDTLRSTSECLSEAYEHLELALALAEGER